MALADELLPEGPEALVAALAEIFVKVGGTREVEILTQARASVDHVRNDHSLGETYCLCLRVPRPLYEVIAAEKEPLGRRILKKARRLMPRHAADKLVEVSIAPLLRADKHWRDRARSWLAEDRAAGPRVPRRPLEQVTVKAAFQSIQIYAGTLGEDD